MRKLSDARADELLKGLFLLSRCVQKVLEERVIEVLGEGLSHSKISLLRDLDQNGAQSPTDVALFLNVSRPAVSQIAAEMIERGLVARSPSRSDSRRHYLQITDRGRSLLHAIEDAQRQLIRKAVHMAPDRRGEQWTKDVQELMGYIVRADDRCEAHCYQCRAYSEGNCIIVGGDAKCAVQESNRPPSE